MLDSKFITVPNVDTLNKISISNKSIVFITGTGQVYTHGKYFPNTDSLSALDVATKTWVGNNYLPLSGGTLTGQLKVSIATGTSPLSVSSTTLNANLNADLLDNQHGSYYTGYADTAVDNIQIGTRNYFGFHKGITTNGSF